MAKGRAKSIKPGESYIIKGTNISGPKPDVVVAVEDEKNMDSAENSVEYKASPLEVGKTETVPIQDMTEVGYPPLPPPKTKKVQGGCKASFCACFKTLLGSKAPSMLWCCCCCRRDRRVLFSGESMAARMMNLIFLLIVIILSCFFIIPPDMAVFGEVDHIAPVYFFICGTENTTGTKGNFTFFPVSGFWKDCRGHAGYFFVYRFFLCLIVFYCVMSVLTFNINSSSEASTRTSCHRGFWLWKFLIIVLLMVTACTALRVYGGGYFEYVMMYFGLIGAYFFAFVEVVCLLDVIELLLIKLKASATNAKRFKVYYWILTCLVYLFGLAVIGLTAYFYATKHFSIKFARGFQNQKEEKKYFDDGAGFYNICWNHVGLLIYDVLLGGIVPIIILKLKNWSRPSRFVNLGLFQCSFIFLYTAFLSWSAISNSPEECRAVFFPYNEYRKNKDVTFTASGMLHGFIAVFAILYYTLKNGPKTKAPWTVGFNKVMYLTSGTPPPTPEAPDPLKAWDDEEDRVTYSWPVYYLLLVLGSFSIMMAMTNYASPWADSAASGSSPAFWLKIVLSFSIIIFFVLPILKVCPAIYPESDFPLREPWSVQAEVAPSGPGLTNEQLQMAFASLMNQQGIAAPTYQQALPPLPSPITPPSSPT